jgi:two-component system OmpR family sensor kinase
MLDRLEHGYDAQRRFTADASHELRSPLSRLRTEIEITLRRPREAAEYVDALASCLDEVQRLTTLVEELLMLTRLDVGRSAMPWKRWPQSARAGGAAPGKGGGAARHPHRV